MRARRDRHAARLFSIAAALVLAVLLSVRSVSADEESLQPNILVLVADDAGWKDSNPYGNPTVHTPNLRRLAESGVTFTRAFVTAPQCSPSRSSMLTGRYAHEIGAEDLHAPIPRGYRILPDHLREQGYFTGSMLKQHIGRAAARQFDWYSPRLGALPRFLHAAGGRPFFLWVGFMDPHRPYAGRRLEHVHNPGEITPPAHLRDTPATRQDLARYYDEIARMDSRIGSYLNELEERGLREETLVIFLSDNGAPFPREKGTLYDAGIATPYIWSWPAVLPEGVRANVLTSTIDLAPTLIELAGAEPPPEMTGRSMAAELLRLSDSLRGGLSGREAIFAERNWHDRDAHMRAVRTDSFKLIINRYHELPFGMPGDISRSPSWRSLRSGRGEGELSARQRLIFQAPRPPIELYDLRRDPGEYRNRAGDPELAVQQARLLGLLDAWIAETGDLPRTEAASPPRRSRRRPDYSGSP